MDLEAMDKKHSDFAERLLRLCDNGSNNNATLYPKGEKWKMVGDPTEGALLTFAVKSGYDLVPLRERFAKVKELPFDSDRKRMTVIVRDLETEKIFAFTKGAPEMMLSICSMDENERKDLSQEAEKMSNRALRVICCAYKELKPNENEYSQETMEKIYYAGMVGMIDPPREEVKEAVRLTHQAGVKPILPATTA